MDKKSALFYALYFIKKTNKNMKAITNKKLQKLLYYIQAWYLVFMINNYLKIGLRHVSMVPQ